MITFNQPQKRIAMKSEMKSEKLFFHKDPYLEVYSSQIESRMRDVLAYKRKLLGETQSLSDFACGYLYFGQQGTLEHPVFREWAPNASDIYLVGDFSDWQERSNYRFESIGAGVWELNLKEGEVSIHDKYFLAIHWNGGMGTRIPAYARCLHQDAVTNAFCATIYAPDQIYQFKHQRPRIDTPLIYEAHVGMSSEERKVSTFEEFRVNVLPYIVASGYNTIQLMAIQEHPYYGSYGYHVANFFAVSSRFGTPNEFRRLVDEAHGFGVAVVMDLVHSHAVKNEQEGLAIYDGDAGMFFYTDERRLHAAWDSLCFNYGKPEVVHFLLSNCKYWMEEYRLDGFRFDGVTSMLYKDHGLERDFTSYSDYYDGNQDNDALIYLSLANELIHDIYPNALCLAEEMSGMPGLCVPCDAGGLGFDYRLAMGIPDYWIKLCKDVRDEDWLPGDIFYQLTSKRVEEKTISYAESHDQALVGDKTLITHLLDAAIYDKMQRSDESLIVDRGIALHKLIRLVTFGLSQGGYLNFMGNEFGHPEWIDFPREGNAWSYDYARRQWSLKEDDALKFQYLAHFDQQMLRLEHQFSFMNSSACECIYENRVEQVLAFKRGALVFVINFHPTNSYESLKIRVDGGKYGIVLCSDDADFGGFARINHGVAYLTQEDVLSVYLPSRTSLVMTMEAH